MGRITVPRRSLFSRGAAAGGGGGGGAHPNEPSGMTVLADESWAFSDGAISTSEIPDYPGLTDDPRGFGFEGGRDNSSIITPSTNPFGGKAVRMLFNASDPNLGGSAPATLTNDYGERAGGPPPMDELYWHFWVRLGKPSGVGNDLTVGWDDAGNAGTKLGFMMFSQTTSAPGYANVFLNATIPGNGAQLESETVAVGVLNPSKYGFGDAKNWFLGDYIDDGSWTEYVVHAKSNTGTNWDGTFKMWRKGVLVLDLDDVKFFPDGTPKRWIKFQITPTFGGGTNEPLTDQYMDWGPFYASGKVNGF